MWIHYPKFTNEAVCRWGYHCEHLEKKPGFQVDPHQRVTLAKGYRWRLGFSTYSQHEPVCLSKWNSSHRIISSLSISCYSFSPIFFPWSLRKISQKGKFQLVPNHWALCVALRKWQLVSVLKGLCWQGELMRWWPHLLTAEEDKESLTTTASVYIGQTFCQNKSIS